MARFSLSAYVIGKVSEQCVLLQSLGVSKELKEAGYALLCVAYPKGDAVVQTVEEDEVYDKQFGNAFAERALKPGDRGSIERDDFALEIANMDE